MPVIVPLSHYADTFLPIQLLEPIGEILNKIGVDLEASYFSWDSNGVKIQNVIYILKETRASFPIIPGSTLQFEPDDSFSGIGLLVNINDDTRIEIRDLIIRLTFSNEHLPAYTKSASGLYVSVERPVPDEDDDEEDVNNEPGFQLDLNLPLVGLDFAGNDILFDTPEIGIPHAAQISNTGVFIDFGDEPNAIDLVLSDTNQSYSESLEQEYDDNLEDDDVEDNDSDDNDENDERPFSELPEGFRGVKINQLAVTYQKDGNIFPPLTFKNVAIGNAGFWGELYLGLPPSSSEITLSTEALNNLFSEENEPESIDVQEVAEEGNSSIKHDVFAVKLVGMKAVIQYFGMGFTQSVPEWGSMLGFVFMPFADKWVSLKATIGGPNGDFMLDVGGTSDSPLISLEHEYFEIKADSIAYKLDDGVHYAIVSGSIKPKIEGFDWPEMKIEDLSINSKGDISIPGGWIKAPNTITLNFGAFKIGINEIGFGNEGEAPELSRQWLGFSGELNLVEGLDLKASVEGLKFSWLKEPAPVGHPTITLGSKDVQVSLKGIAVEFEIPNTLSFKGTVKYEELTPENNGGTGLTGKLFRGNIDLNLISVRLQIEAELIIGKIKDADGNEFTTFFIVLGAQLPTGIPLGATGTSLYGVKGLGAYNTAPTKTESQNWYEWYKAPPERNITSMQKWMPRYDNYAFGAGVTIGTMFDDGFTLNMSVMLAILLPGPVIVLEGKANLLKQRAEGQQDTGGPEGAFYLLAVLDGRAGTFMLNVDVKYSLEDVITIGAGLEAFFDFNNSSNWYVYIGRKTPETKRIRAEILSLFSANAYFMIDNTSLQTGASVGFDFRKKYGPVAIVFVSKISFDATIFWQPMQLEGALELEASLGIKVFGIGLELYLYMLLEGRVPKPYWIHGIGEVGIKLFWPLPDLKVKIELEWSQPADTPAAWPLLKDCTFTHHKGSGTTWPILIGDENVPAWNDFPIVPIDARPVLTFSRPVNNLGYENKLGAISIFKTLFDQVGDQKFLYKLDKENLILERYNGNSWEEEKRGVNSDEGNEFIIERDSIINIQDDLDPNEPQIQLWKYSARDHVNDYGREDYNQNKPACKPRPHQKWITVNWQGIPNDTEYESIFEYARLSFITEGTLTPKVYNENLTLSNVTVNFPNDIFYAAILFNDKSSGSIKGSVAINGEYIGEMAAATNVLIYRSSTPFNSIRLSSTRQNHGKPQFRIISITYMTKEGAIDQLIGTDNPGPSATREKINGKLFLKPAQFYRIKVNTSVDINDRLNAHSAENYIYFRTDEGPGVVNVSKNPLEVIDDRNNIPFNTLNYKEKSINLLDTYIERTLPVDGALNHYLDYDVGVQFNESYVEKLFKEPIRIKFRDRNGKLLNDSTGSFILGFLPLFHQGLLSWLQDKEDGACSPISDSVTIAPYLNFTNSRPFKKNSLYRAEMVVKTDLGEHSLHEFQFTTSKYSNFKEHILSSYINNTLSVIELPKVSSLPPSFTSNNLNTLLRKYRRIVSSFNLQDELDLLKKKENYDQAKQLRIEINNTSLELFDELDKYAIEAFTVFNMQNRPRAEKFELFKIPVSTNRSLLLIESPEPIDWFRVKSIIRVSNNRRTQLNFIWNNDKTRAFISMFGNPKFGNGNFEITLVFSGDKDPISGVILNNDEIVKEKVIFQIKL